MAKQNEALFEESSQGAVSAITAVVFVLSAVLVFGGMVLFSYGFGQSTEQVDAILYTGGFVATILGFALPFTLLGITGK